jgi:uncharacterized protein
MQREYDKDLTRVLGDVNAFLDRVFARLEQNGIDVSAYEMDHICYRTDSRKLYDQKVLEMCRVGEFVAESFVNGRPIAIFKLLQPYTYKGRTFHLVEIPAPKQGRPFPAGLEHAEFVIDIPLNELVSRHPSLKFNHAGLAKSFNAEVELAFGDCAVKFHQMSLQNIIELDSTMAA